MLSALFQRAQLSHSSTSFHLEDIEIHLQDMDDPATLEMLPRPEDRCFVLRCWRNAFGEMLTPYTVAVWPAFCGEQFVLYCKTPYDLLTKTGQPIPRIYYAGRDRRICNRLTASLLIDWNKGTEQ